MPLIQLVYVSTATQRFTEADLLALLGVSRKNNEPVGISGLLLHRDGNFIQVLEGEEEVVLKTQARIAKDPRHSGIITILKAPIVQRTFTDWSMAFRNLDSPEVRSVPGYSEFMNEDWLGRQMLDSPNRALKLLQLFRKNQR